jgi:hypothetical protein
VSSVFDDAPRRRPVVDEVVTDRHRRPLSARAVERCGHDRAFSGVPRGDVRVGELLRCLELGAMLRAYDKDTGREVGAVYMPAPQSGSPMTYMHDGEQYLVVAISGAQYAGELLAYKLPRR